MSSVLSTSTSQPLIPFKRIICLSAKHIKKKNLPQSRCACLIDLVVFAPCIQELVHVRHTYKNLSSNLSNTFGHL